MELKFCNSKEQWKIRQYGEYVEYAKRPRLIFNKNRGLEISAGNIKIGIGDTIHLHSKRGSYRINGVSGNTIGITCKKWVEEFKRKDRISFFEVVDIDDVKCLHGNNERLKRYRAL